MADAWLGKTLSHYEIVEKLGEGGMGVVYKARDTRLDRFVAIKILPADKVGDEDRKRRFAQEAKAASALNHPNIITIHDIAEEHGTDFIVMEYVAGKTLDHIIERHGMRLNEALKYAVQAADALAAAHEAGIIHRDLKPSNVMVTEKGHVKVLDFGLAKLTEKAEPDQAATQTLQRAASPLTDEGTVLGTAAYMSPEQAEGKKIDARSDIFSFGSLLYEMVTGRKAFSGDSRMSTLTAILRDEAKLPSDTSDAIPRDLQKIITRCLRKDPARRFQTMADLKVALEEVKEESESGRLTEVAAATTARGRSRLVYAGFAVALMLAAAAVFWWRSRAPAAGSSGSGLSLRQLTQDTGRTTDPAISPDGKLVAYASDRAGDGGMDIWVQQLTAGAQPIRLTRNKADDDNPSFSPDSGQIVFDSGREGGGIYVMPALGGEERLLLRGPYYTPRFSPNGQWVATWNALQFQGRIVVVPVSGGAPRPIAQEFYNARWPVWSPDGTKILFPGERRQGDATDWWVAPLDGGPAVKAGVSTIVGKLAVGGLLPRPDEWLDDQILFSAGNLWRIPFSSRDYKLGTPERLTTSTAPETAPRAISGTKGWRTVFASSQRSQSLWSLPLDLNNAKALGEPKKLFPDGLQRTTPSLSADGSRMSYVYRGLEGYGVRVRDTKTGTETTLVQAPNEMRARLSPDGSTLAYTPTITEAEKTVYLVSATGGDARKFCETCGLIYDWSPDGKKLLYRTGNPMRFWTIEAATGRQTEIISHPNYGIYGGVYSFDQRWLVIQLGGLPVPPQVLFIAPVGENGAAGPQSEWITILANPANVRPWWSPDGNVVYYVWGADRQATIWARRLDPNTKQPRGEAFVVYAPSAQRSIQAGHPFGPAMVTRQLIFPISESTGNIWLGE